MSLYTLMNGVNPATFYILPMLDKHPDEYPRFRDCFVGKMSRSEKLDSFGIPGLENDMSKIISVYTRTGGGNRESYQNEIDELRAMPGYIRDFDDDFDCTFATFEFSVPEEFKDDFDLVLEGKLSQTSQPYKDRLYRVFPKLKGKFDELFANKD